MFGYVVPCKAELKVKEYETYKSVYCSLCLELEKSYGWAAKFALNYDFAFMALVGMAADPGYELQFCNGRCRGNCLKKQRYISRGGALHYSAACLLMSAEFKFKDTASDEGVFKKIGAFFARIFFARSLKKARNAYPETYAFLKDQMRQQAKSEAAGEKRIDRAADPTAQSLGHMFALLSNDATVSRVLGRMGNLLGRYVYLADAGDDLCDDIKRKRYNPLALADGFSPNATGIKQAVDALRPELFNIRAEIATCYNLLDIHQFKPIIDNIIFLGLAGNIRNLTAERKGKQHGRSV